MQFFMDEYTHSIFNAVYQPMLIHSFVTALLHLEAFLR